MFNSHAQRAPKRFKYGFSLMMRISSGYIVDMQRYQGMIVNP
jgi:hypothetical protein